MRKLILAAGVLISLAADAQLKQQLGTYGVRARRLQSDSAFRVPTVQVGIRDFNLGFDTAQLYYNKVDSALKVYTGSQWLDVIRGGSGSSWLLPGNSGTNPGTDFIGTTDAQAFVTKTNNSERMRVASGGNVGIGTNNPQAILHVAGTLRFVTGAQGSGKVLVSDADGDAEWTTLAGGDVVQSQENRSAFPVDISRADTLIKGGNSLETDYGGALGYVSIVALDYDLDVVDVALSGSGSWHTASVFNTNITSVNSFAAITGSGGFNDLRRSASAATYRKVAATTRSAIASNFINVVQHAIAGTTSGSWSTFNATSFGGRATAGQALFNNTSGSYIEWTETGNNFFIGYFSQAAGGFTGGEIDIHVDGVLYQHKVLNESDGVSDGVYDNNLCPGVSFIKGLSSGSHTIRVTNTTNNYVYIDFLSTVKPPEECFSVIVPLIPYMTAVGYATSPANATNAVFDLGNDSLVNVVNQFVGWPVTYSPSNNYGDTTNGMNVDGIHQNALGFRLRANSVESAILKSYGLGNTVPDASGSVSGIVNLSNQTLGTGDKRFSGGIQVLGALAAPTGSGGFELEYASGVAYITAYNRGGAAWVPLSLRGSTMAFTNSGVTYTTVSTGGEWTFERGFIVNNGGANSDTRIEGVGDANLFFVDASADNIGMGTASPAASAKLDITSTAQGVLFPRMTTTQKNAISSPAEGLVVYDLTLHKLCVFTGSVWETVTSL